MKVAGTHLHICNSGVSFDIEDAGSGPEIVVTSSSFGNLNHSFRVATTVEGLQALQRVIDEALNHEFSKHYTHAAEPQ